MKYKKIILLAVLITLTYSCKTLEINEQISDYERIYPIYKKYEGTPYRYGGTDARGFDCSGFVGAVYKESFGITLPRSTELLWNYGKRVNMPMVGDLVFFSPSDSYNHVGIYVGNDEFIHSSSSKGVMKSRVHDRYYWSKYFVMYRRITK